AARAATRERVELAARLVGEAGARGRAGRAAGVPAARPTVAQYPRCQPRARVSRRRRLGGRAVRLHASGLGREAAALGLRALSRAPARDGTRGTVGAPGGLGEPYRQRLR